MSIGIGYVTMSGYPAGFATPTCRFGTGIADVVIGMLSCAGNLFQQFIFLFNVQTTIGLVNIVVIFPYIVFMLAVVLDFLRGIG